MPGQPNCLGSQETRDLHEESYNHSSNAKVQNAKEISGDLKIGKFSFVHLQTLRDILVF